MCFGGSEANTKQLIVTQLVHVVQHDMHHRQQTTYNNLPAVCVLTLHASMQHLDSVVTQRETICLVVSMGKPTLAEETSQNKELSRKEYYTHTNVCCLQKLLVVYCMKPFEKKSLLDPT